VESIEGEPGDFKVTVTNYPRYIDPIKCTGCGECAKRCPVTAINMYNLGLDDRKATYIDYPQAVPLAFSIDIDTCIGCGLCEMMCLAKAVNYEDEQKTSILSAGAVILTPGSEGFDPSGMDVLGYGNFSNVLTSEEFERILSASGPYRGHLMRPLDREAPKKIAWIQCVGSRDVNVCGNGYCSSVCCMYALKEAMIAKEHAHDDLDCAIFNMDIRSFGKDYEKYYNRAKDEQGIRFIKSRIHSIDEDRATGDLTIKYTDESGQTEEETFNMVVLSVGLQIPESVTALAERLDIQVDKYNFAATETFDPVKTSRPGIFVGGVFQGPKDIPGSVVDASAAACAAAINLAETRGIDAKSVEMPEEIDISEAETRIGVFVCNCGINIGGVVDVPAVADYAATLPYVAFVDQNLFTCSQDTQDKIREVIEENNLNRVVVASCSPRTHEPLFQETLQACGLNKYLFEMANIRDQDSWVHGNDPEAATEKAKDLVRMAVARAGLLKPLKEKSIPINRRALVIGGGVAGMNAALGLADQGYEVVIVEKEAQLGGLSRELTVTIEGADIQKYLLELVDRVTGHEKIQVLTESLIVGFSGFKGNFTTEIMVGPGMYERKIDHGVVILATGANEYKPEEYLYGQDYRVATQIELGKRLEVKGADDLNRVVMIQCVGSRNEKNPTCSRVCCQSAVKNALHIKELNPDAEIYILYRDMRMYGLLEDYYTEARQQGIIFSRFRPDNPPDVKATDEGIEVTFKDHILQRDLTVTADLLALSAGMVAEDTEELASILKLPRNEEGYFIEAHVKLRPVDLANEGIFLCGTSHSPKLISEAIPQALAAASRASIFLSQSEITLSAVTARVNPDLCAACLVCVRACPYGVPRINEEGVSEIDEALCHGCGICAAECPAKAIELNWYEDDQVMSKVEALLEGVL
jgi:heterodisulfide reductase subunit A-like polyferredoxin